MKAPKTLKIALFVCASFITIYLISCQNSQSVSEPTNGIIGKWEYLKSVLPDGSEVKEAIHTEHYYADGSLLFVRMALEPTPLDSFYESADDIKAAYKEIGAGIATYEIDEENSTLSWTSKASSNPDDIGVNYTVEFQIKGDTLIIEGYYYFVRVKE